MSGVKQQARALLGVWIDGRRGDVLAQVYPTNTNRTARAILLTHMVTEAAAMSRAVEEICRAIQEQSRE